MNIKKNTCPWQAYLIWTRYIGCLATAWVWNITQGLKSEKSRSYWCLVMMVTLMSIFHIKRCYVINREPNCMAWIQIAECAIYYSNASRETRPVWHARAAPSFCEHYHQTKRCESNSMIDGLNLPRAVVTDTVKLSCTEIDMNSKVPVTQSR